jgi:predicted transcriptional regulator of viral defense system
VNTRQNEKLKKIGVFTLAEAEKVGLSQQTISHLLKADKLTRVARGVYLHPEAELDREVGFQIACKRIGPPAAVGGLSALFYYNLVEQVPSHNWMMVSPGRKTDDPLYKLIRTKTPLDCQIIEKNGYRIVTIERAIIEGLKYVKKIGERTAVKAARDALAKGETTELKLGRAAKELGLTSVVAKYLEVITP